MRRYSSAGRGVPVRPAVGLGGELADGAGDPAGGGGLSEGGVALYVRLRWPRRPGP